MADINGGFWYPAPPNPSSSVPALAASLLDASAEKLAFVFVVPKTGTLDLFEFKTGSVLNNPDNGIRLSFQDLDANGDPDGTQDQFRDITGAISANTWQVPGLITSDGTDTGTKRSVTAGQKLACVIEFVSFVASDSFQVQNFAVSATPADYADGGSYSDHLTASWSKTGIYPNLALKYETTGYVPITEFINPIHTINSRTYNSGSTPDEIALRFQPPTTVECDGFWLRGDIDNDGDVVLYDTDGTSVLATFTLDASQRINTNGYTFSGRWAAVTLNAGGTYRLSLKPTTGSNLTLYTITINSSGLAAAMVGGAEWYRSERTDAGAWSQTQTERPYMGLHLSSVGSASSSGAFTGGFLG